MEGNEAITVSGANAALTVNGTILTLTDDDGDPAVNLSASPSSVSEGAGATTVTVTATFSNSVTYNTAKTVTVSLGDGTDSATSGDGLHGGERLRHHDCGGPDERQRDVHPDADRRHAGGGQRDDHGVGCERGPDGDRNKPDADR